MTATMDPTHTTKADDLRQAVRQYADATVDAVVDTRALRAVPVEALPESAPATERVKLVARTADGEVGVNLLEGAHDQLGYKTGIPKKYYDRMLHASPDLLVQNLNHWLHTEPEPRLLRMWTPVTEEDHERVARTGTIFSARAVLSNRYRPLDHADMLDQLFEEIDRMGIVVGVSEWHLDPRRLQVQFSGPEHDINEVVQRLRREQPDKVAAHWTNFHEIIAASVLVTNSETGHASLRVEPTVRVLRCENRMIVTDKMRVMHLGGRKDADESWMQDDTKVLDDAATFLKVRDKFAELFVDDTVEGRALAIAQAMDEEFSLPETTPLMEFVGNVGKGFRLNNTEVEVLRDEYVNERAASGQGQSVFTMAQAFTAAAKRMPDVERRNELERMGWQILGKPVRDLLRAGKADEK